MKIRILNYRYSVRRTSGLLKGPDGRTLDANIDSHARVIWIAADVTEARFDDVLRRCKRLATNTLRAHAERERHEALPEAERVSDAEFMAAMKRCGFGAG